MYKGPVAHKNGVTEIYQENVPANYYYWNDMRSENLLSEMVQFINSKNPENVWEMDKNDQSYLKTQGWGPSLRKRNILHFLFFRKFELHYFLLKIGFFLKFWMFNQNFDFYL